MQRINILILIVLVGLNCRNNSSVREEFAIAAIDQIHSIIIKNDLLRSQQNLTRKEERWYINDSFKIRPDAMQNIFRVVPQIKILYYPPKASWEYILDVIRKEGLEISFLNIKGNVIQKWYLGGTTNDERGTYAFLEDAKQPFVVHVPGFEGNLATRFKMPLEEWRDRMILDLEPSTFNKISLVYPDQSESSFTFLRDSGRFKLINNLGYAMKADQSVIKNYLDQISHLASESIENDFVQKSVVLSGPHHARLDIQTSERNLRLTFYQNQLSQDSEVERMFVYDEHDFYLAQVRILQKVFRPLSYFEIK